MVGQLIPSCHTVRLFPTLPADHISHWFAGLLFHASVVRKQLFHSHYQDSSKSLHAHRCVRLLQVFFEQGNHFLYIEEPEKFNQLVVDFAQKGLAAVSSTCSV